MFDIIVNFASPVVSTLGSTISNSLYYSGYTIGTITSSTYNAFSSTCSYGLSAILYLFQSDEDSPKLNQVYSISDNFHNENKCQYSNTNSNLESYSNQFFYELFLFSLLLTTLLGCHYYEKNKDKIHASKIYENVVYANNYIFNMLFNGCKFVLNKCKSGMSILASCLYYAYNKLSINNLKYLTSKIYFNLKCLPSKLLSLTLQCYNYVRNLFKLSSFKTSEAILLEKLFEDSNSKS